MLLGDLKLLLFLATNGVSLRGENKSGSFFLEHDWTCISLRRSRVYKYNITQRSHS
jgi:hypothetical protein